MRPRTKWRVKQRELVYVCGEAAGERHDDGENHRGCADDCRADEYRLGGGFEGVARAVVGFQHGLGSFEVHVDVEVSLQFRLDVGNLFDEGKFINRLRVVGDGAVGIHSDGDGAHAQETESDETECKNRSGDHQVSQARISAHVCDQIADGHESDHGQAEVVTGEISRRRNRKECLAMRRPPAPR